MNVVRQRLFHTLRRDVPTETLKRKVLELEKKRKMRNSKKKDQLFVEVPESMSYLDTATMPMVLFAVGVAIFAKLLMMVSSYLNFILIFIISIIDGTIILNLIVACLLFDHITK